MKTIKLWYVDSTNELAVHAVENVNNTKTEELVEELLVKSPDLLMNGLRLVGRQMPTIGGPLDLLGIDEDGRLVVFELKRGTLTRDAVAQVLDYASDLAVMDTDRLAKFIEDHSGKLGVEKIEDFADWYGEQFPEYPGTLQESPKIVLVGLGVDERARRIVSFLAAAGIDVQLLTFHVFQSDGKLFFARQDEIVAPPKPPRLGSNPTKQDNQKALDIKAAQLQVADLLNEVFQFLSEGLPTAYSWPGKWSYVFSLRERTEKGNTSLRCYVSVYLGAKEPGVLQLVFQDRAVRAAGGALDSFCADFDEFFIHDDRYKKKSFRVSQEHWPKMASKLGPVLKSMIKGWKAIMTDSASGESQSEDGTVAGQSTDRQLSAT
jgi:hypothetical protein